MYCKAKITLNNGVIRVFNANDEDRISDFLYGIIGEKSDEEVSGVPTFIEASSWCSMGAVGEVFEREDFIIELIDEE